MKSFSIFRNPGKIFGLCLLPFLPLMAKAGWEVPILSAPVRGNDIVVNTGSTPSTEVADQYLNIGLPWAYKANQHIDVRLMLDETQRDYFGFDWQLQVTYTIKYYDINDNYLSQKTGEKIAISYEQASGAFKDRTYNRYEDAYKAAIFITDIQFVEDDGTPTTYNQMPPGTDYTSIKLDMVYEVERYFIMDNMPGGISHLPATENIGPPANNEVELVWDTDIGAETYDVEWVFLDVPPGVDFEDENIEFDWRDATRISTAANSYKLALVYPRGVFVYRVRSVGMEWDSGLNKLIRVFSEWSSDQVNLDEFDPADDNHFYWDGFETLVNWTSAVDYAEEGKKKEIVSFYDGSGRMRQTVTMLNTDQNAVVAETYYDHAGRPAVNALPVPVEDGWIKYYPDFNNGFNRNYFDEQTQLATAGPQAMDAGAASLAYYSADNTFLGDAEHIKFIPDANGYPYVQTRVLNDGTGRPHSTSGVGFMHKLKGGHDTRYFYGSPGGQEELDRLFGNEAGYVANYKKNMTVDANNQVSITYLDGYGRTVATALAGDGESLGNVQAIDAPAPETITVSLLPGNTITDDGSRVTKDFLVPVTGEYTFTYALESETLETPCWQDKTCKFDLSIKLFVEQEGEYFEIAAATVASSDITEVNPALELVEVLNPGKYIVTKELTLNETSRDAYAGDLRTFLLPDENGIPDPLPTCFDFVPVETPCPDCAQNCSTSYSFPLTVAGNTITVFRNPNGQRYYSAALLGGGVTAPAIAAADPTVIINTTVYNELQAAMATCVSNCSQEVTVTPADECTMARNILIADMMPGGQYFENGQQLGLIEAELSEIAQEAMLTTYHNATVTEPTNRFFWINTLIPDNVQQDLADMADINWVNDNRLFWIELANLWDSKIETHAGYPALRDQLLTLHPEYCTHYYFCIFNQQPACCETMEVTGGAYDVKWGLVCEDPNESVASPMTSNEYDQSSFGINDFDEAVATNRFNPLNLPDAYTLGLASSANPALRDPYFCPLGWAGESESGLADQMLDFLMDFYPNPADPTEKLSLYEVLTWDPTTYVAPTPLPPNHAEIIYFLHYLHGDGGSIEGILDENAALPGLDVNGHLKMSPWHFFRQEYFGKKKMLIKGAYTQWAKENCGNTTAYPNFPIPSAQCGSSAPVGANLECADACYLVSFDANGDLVTDNGEFAGNGEDFFGFMARYQSYCFPVGNNPSAYAADFCDNLADGFVYTWMNQLENQYIGCTANDKTLGELFQTPQLAGMREQLAAYFRTYFLHACSLSSGPPYPSLGAPASMAFAPLASPVAVGTLFPSGPDFPWNPPSGLTQIDKPADVLLILAEELAANHGISLYCPDGLYTPSMDISPTLQPGENPAPANVDSISCACGKWAQWLMNTEDAFTGVSPDFSNPLRYEAFGETDLTFLNTTAIEGALNELQPHLGSSFPVENFINFCRNPALYETGNVNGFSAADIPEVFSCTPVTNVSAPLTCEELNAITDGANNLNTYRAAVDSYVATFRTAYTGTCLLNLVQRETFTMEYALNEYHYTLYYYDQAGNLVKTVPPAGVDFLDASERAQSVAHRNQNHSNDDYAYDGTTPNVDFVWPEHKLVTNYVYNSNNQPIYQSTPDGGVSRFWYDKLGRMALSQNAKQATPIGGKVRYSYTVYDSLGRIAEVGQLENKNPDQVNDELTSNPAALASYIGAGYANKTQVTRTYYDISSGPAIPNFTQKNLRNRVAKTEYAENGGNNVNFTTYYSYDIHGNVDELVHQATPLQAFGRKFIRVRYEYDLVSGKVNRVVYQPGQSEMFIHRYEYDADNRLTHVYTSRDEVIWDLDAKYLYYPHGPLARVEIGEKQVQGIDYAYTLHGWLKAVNGLRIAQSGSGGTGDLFDFDMGRDGVQNLGELHTAFARDAFAFGLFYYNSDGDNTQRDDYTPIDDDDDVQVDRHITDQLADPDGILERGLYNGNIAAMTTTLRNTQEQAIQSLRKTYQYDQLNRLVESHSYLAAGDAADAFTYTGAYYTHYGYDANGNIRNLQRKDQSGTLMDNLLYHYADILGGPLTHNRLLKVQDNASPTAYTGDLEDQTGIGDNYTYDAIGNLVADQAEEIDEIQWNVYGKVKSIKRRANSSKPNLEFYYDPSGQRFAKVEKPLAGNSDPASWQYTFYLRDAQGTPLCIYNASKKPGLSQYSLTASERPIYGSARIGMDNSGVPSGFSMSKPAFTNTITLLPPDQTLSTIRLQDGRVQTDGHTFTIRTKGRTNNYTPDDFSYYRSEGTAEVHYETPVAVQELLLPESVVRLYRSGQPCLWTNTVLLVSDGDVYLGGGTLACDSLYPPSDEPYELDSAIVLGEDSVSLVIITPITLHHNAEGIYASSPSSSVVVRNGEIELGDNYASVLMDDDEFVLTGDNAILEFVDGEATRHATEFFTPHMRSDEFGEQLPDNVGYAYDHSQLTLPDGNTVYDVFGVEVIQRNDVVEDFTNSTLRSGWFDFRYYTATEIVPVPAGLLLKQHAGSVTVTSDRNGGVPLGLSFNVLRNDTPFAGSFTVTPAVLANKTYRASSVSIPGFGTMPLNTTYTVSDITLTENGSGSIHIPNGQIIRTLSGYTITMSGSPDDIAGTFEILNSSTLVSGSTGYEVGKYGGSISFYDDSTVVDIDSATVLYDNIYLDPVVANAGIPCTRMDSIANAMLHMPWLDMWSYAPDVAVDSAYLNGDTLYVLLNSTPLGIPWTGNCNFAIDWGNGPVTYAGPYTFNRNVDTVIIPFTPDTLHLPFAASWRTDEGVWLRNPYLVRDGDGCSLESREAVRFYTNLNLLNLPYERTLPGGAEMNVFGPLTACSLSLDAEGPSEVVYRANIRALDQQGYALADFAYADVTQDDDELVFSVNRSALRYLNTGAAPDDTIYLDSIPLILIESNIRYGMLTMQFEAPERFGVFVADGFNIKTQNLGITVHGGLMRAAGTRWELRTTYFDLTDEGPITASMTAVRRPASAGMAERIITGGEYAGEATIDDYVDPLPIPFDFTQQGPIFSTSPPKKKTYTFEAGRKIYELGNHLGNVLVTISDRKLQVEGTGGKVKYYLPDVLTMTDYYPFGSPLPGRTESQLACTDVLVPTTIEVLDENFDAGTGGFTVVNGTTLTQTPSGRLKLEQPTCVGCGNWGTAKTFAQTAGTLYHVNFTLNTSSCAPLNSIIVRIKNTSGTVIATQAYTTSGEKTFTFTANQTGTGSIEFLVSNTGCDFLIDNVLVTYNGTTTQSVCETYRFAFNGKEKTDEWSGEGNIYDYGFRIYDPRIARFLSVDPLAPEYPFYSPYHFAGNSPIYNIDLDGQEPLSYLIPWYGDLVRGTAVGIKDYVDNSNEHAEHLIYTLARQRGYATAWDVVTAYTHSYLKHGVGNWSDANDMAVLLKGKNLDGSKATVIDYVFASVGVFIPVASGSAIKRIGPFVEGFVKGYKNGESVVFAARKIEKYGHKGTKEYNAVLKEIRGSKGETFVTKTKDEAMMFLKESFPGISDETGKQASKFGYRVDEVSETTQQGLKNGHDGGHINYYNKETGVRGTITWEDQ